MELILHYCSWIIELQEIFIDCVIIIFMHHEQTSHGKQLPLKIEYYTFIGAQFPQPDLASSSCVPSSQSILYFPISFAPFLQDLYKILCQASMVQIKYTLCISLVIKQAIDGNSGVSHTVLGQLQSMKKVNASITFRSGLLFLEGCKNIQTFQSRCCKCYQR